MSYGHPQATSFRELEIDPSHPVRMTIVHGAEFPVRLSLAAQDRLGSTQPPETRQITILGMDMGFETALAIFSEIRKLAQTTGWPLPKEDEDQA